MSLRRMHWRQGLFLAPQHFQHLDTLAEAREAALRASLGTHQWGFERVQVRSELRDRDQLVRTGLFEVTSCTAIFPSGGQVHTGADVDPLLANAVVWPRPFREYLDPAGKPLGIYLGWPRWRDDVSNVGSDFKGGSAAEVPPRYTVRSYPARDRFDLESPEAEVPQLFANLVLLFSNEARFDLAEGNYELLHLADVAALPSVEGAARIVSEYIPAVLRVAAAPRLKERLENLRDLLVGKAQEFAVLKRQRGIRASTTGSQDAVRLLILQSLNRYAVRLQHLLEGETVHPWIAYGCLRELVAEFSAFSEQYGMFGESLDRRGILTDLPAYRHEALSEVFGHPIDVAQELVRGVSAGPEAGIALAFENGFYRATLPETLFEGDRSRYYLLFESSRTGPEVEALVQRTGKICNIEIMNQVRQFANVGLKVTYKPVPPEDLPQRGANHHYFEIDPAHEVWKRVRAARNLAILCTELDPGDTTIRLLCVRPD